MKKYEAMIIVRPDLSEEDKKGLFEQIGETVAKNNGKVSDGSVWSERRKLFFPIKKQQEGIYYLLNFTAQPQSITKINHVYGINENILRVLFTRID